VKVLLNGLQAGNLSGTGRYTTQLARWLPEVSQDLDFIAVWPKHVPRPRLTRPSREAFLVRDGQSALRRLKYDQFGIRRERQRLMADLIHYPANVGNLTAMGKTVLTVHDLSFLRHPEWFRFERAAYYRSTVRRSARLAERVIADSETTAADLRERLDIPDDKIDVVPLGVDETFQPVSDDARAKAQARYRLPERYFLYIGTLEPRKNVVRLIQAWSMMAHEFPQDLVLAGRFGWKARAIREATEKSRQAARIHFPGFIAEGDLPGVLCGADAFVWPSLWEGFGLPPLEAMACGVPVLTSNVSSMREVIDEGSVAVVDPEDVNMIAKRMGQLARDDELREALRERGRRCAERYTWKRTAEMTVGTYRKALNLE